MLPLDFSFCCNDDVLYKIIDSHLRSPEFFDIEKYGRLSFSGNKAEKAGYIIKGRLNRKEWGLNWNTALEKGGFLLSDDVSINWQVQLVKQS